MELHIAKDPEQLGREMAEWLTGYIREVLSRQDYFTFVLSGGSTPKQLYTLLSSSPYSQSIPWEKIHFFWGDERVVPFEDDRNNARMAYHELLEKVGVVKENIHVMRTDLTPDKSATAYEAILRRYFDKKTVTFDFVLLGMGDDGHTLSLFPGLNVVHESDKWVTSFFLKTQDMFRITLTAPVVNKAACVAFLVAGAAKSDVLREVLEGERDVNRLPSQIIRPEHGQLHWFVDEAAARDITRR